MGKTFSKRDTDNNHKKNNVFIVCGNNNDNKDDPLFSRLPDEIVHKIFSYLSVKDVLLGTSGVSRRFRRLCSFATPEMDLDTTWYRNPWMRSDHFKLLVTLAAPYLRVLKLDPSYFFLEEDRGHWNLMDVAAHTLKHCPLLEQLEMSRLNSKQLNRSSLRTMKEHGGNLRRLSLLLDKDDTGPADFSVRINVRLHCSVGDQARSNCGRSLESFEIRTYFYRSDGGGEELQPPCSLPGTKELFSDGVTRSNHALGVEGKCEVLEKLVISMHGSNLKSFLHLPRLRELFIATHWQTPFGRKGFASVLCKRLRELGAWLLSDPDLNDEVVTAVAELVKISLDSIVMKKGA